MDKDLKPEKRKYNLDEILEIEKKRCSVDSVYFSKKYCHIQSVKSGKILFDLYPFQEKVLKDLCINDHEDWFLILKSRQLGISTLLAAYSSFMLRARDNYNIIVIANKQDVAKNIVTKVRFINENLPSYLKRRCTLYNQLSVEFDNKSKIEALSSKSDSGRSYAASLLIIDEAAFIDNFEELWASIYSTTVTGGRVIILSTPNGVGNYFHKLWVEAENGASKFKTIKLDWRVHPHRDQKWRDEQDRMMGKDLASQECDANFLSSGFTVIDNVVLDFHEMNTRDPLEKRGFSGDYWIWEYPNNYSEYIIGADVGRGDGGDNSSFSIIEAKSGRQVAEYKANIGTKEFGRMLVTVGYEWNKALLAIENTQIGWSVIQEVVDLKYPNLLYTNKNDVLFDNALVLKRSLSYGNNNLVPGIATTTKTRPVFMDKLTNSLLDRNIKVSSKRLISELRTFVWKDGKQQAERGYKDDLILSYAICLWARDVTFRLRAAGIEFNKMIIDNFQKTVYKSQPSNNSWDWNVGGNKENLKWLL